MKAKNEARVRAIVRDEMAADHGVYHVITVTFENRTVEIPYLPWKPRTKVSLPGHWVESEPIEAELTGTIQ